MARHDPTMKTKLDSKESRVVKDAARGLAKPKWPKAATQILAITRIYMTHIGVAPAMALILQDAMGCESPGSVRDDGPVVVLMNLLMGSVARKAHKEGTLDKLGDTLGGILGDRAFVNHWMESRRGGVFHDSDECAYCGRFRTRWGSAG